MSTTFLNLENGGFSTLRADHAADDGVLKIQTGHGARFGETWPARVSVFHPTSGEGAIYSLSGRDDDDLQVNGAIEATTDVIFPAGSTVSMRWTKGAYLDLIAAIAQLESSAAAGSAGLDGQVQIKDGSGFGALAGTAIGVNAVAIGPSCVAIGDNSHALGSSCGAYADGAIAVGYLNKATGRYSFASGLQSNAGFSLLACTIAGKIVTVHASAGDVSADFACEDCPVGGVSLSNLTGSSGPTTVRATIDGTTVGGGAVYNGTNTILTLTEVVTNHTSGVISNGAGGQGAHAMGSGCWAPGDASHALGYSGLADTAGKLALGGGMFVGVKGSCQKTTMMLGGFSTSASPVVLMFNASANLRRPIIRENCTYGCTANITARKVLGGPEHALFLRQFIAHNEAGVVSLEGAVVTIGTDINTPGWSVDITADDANNAIQVAGTAVAQVRWACCLEAVELK